MKKKLMAFLVASCAAITMIGCGTGTTGTTGNGSISNEQITIEQYKGLEVEKVEAAVVTDEEVEASIESTLQTLGEEKEVTKRAVKEGDTALIDYVGTKDGVAFDGGSAEGYSLVIGSGNFIDGFEDGIIGHEIGETFDLNLTFPEDYDNEELNGAEVVFTVTLQGITKTVYPDLTDELVASTLSTTATTVEEYKEEVRQQLQQSNEESATYELQERVWQALSEKCTVAEYPEDAKQEIKDNVTSQYEYIASMYGMEVEDLIQAYYGLTLEEIAENTLLQEYAVALISEKENLVLSDEEYQEGLTYYADQYGYTNEEMEEAVGVDAIKETLLQEKVTEFLVDNCVQVEATEEVTE